jgi:hypothetical protein
MIKSKKTRSALTLFIVLGATLAFLVNNNQPGDLYAFNGYCGSCARATCETINNTNAPCLNIQLYTDPECLQPFTGAAWVTANGK